MCSYFSSITEEYGIVDFMDYDYDFGDDNDDFELGYQVITATADDEWKWINWSWCPVEDIPF